jgi:xanthine dehydrogenase accessory factor
MTELQAILKAWRILKNEERDAVLATVVHVSGSAYRRPGARLLLLPDSRRIGSVSGGCLEGEIARKARWWTESNPIALKVFDTTSEDDAVWGFGLGCNGVVQVLIERVSAPGGTQLLQFLEEAQQLRKPVVIVTVVRSSLESEFRVGQRLLAGNGPVRGELAISKQADNLTGYALESLQNRRSQFINLERADLFIEYVPPSPSLVVIGAGYDARPLVTIAKELGFYVTVSDARPANLVQDRFPGADKLVLLANVDVARSLPIDADDTIVLMTHSYGLDRQCLSRILNIRPRYVGLLGPRARAERLFADLGRGMPDYVHAPVGLDIGGDSAAAVALSIIAEIQAVFEGRSGNMLKHKCGPIHTSLVSQTAADTACRKLEAVHSSLGEVQIGCNA